MVRNKKQSKLWKTLYKNIENHPIYTFLYFIAICFDGKESESLVWLDGKNQKIREETYTILAYPGGHSLGFVTIDDKTGFYYNNLSYDLNILSI